MNCNRCQAITKTGERCSREASCNLGCDYVCWQHASLYKKDRYCTMKRIPPCLSNESSRIYPCRTKNVINWGKEESNIKSAETKKPKKKKGGCSPSKHPKRFPCKVKGVKFNNIKEYDEYYKSKIKGPYRRKKRDIIAEKANSKLLKIKFYDAAKTTRVTFGNIENENIPKKVPRSPIGILRKKKILY